MSDKTHGKNEPFQALVDDQARCIGEARSAAKSGQDQMARWPAMKRRIDKVAVPRLKFTMDALRRAARALRREEPRVGKLPMLVKEIKRANRFGNVLFLRSSILSVWLRIGYLTITIQWMKIRLWLEESNVTPRGVLLILLLFSIIAYVLLSLE